MDRPSKKDIKAALEKLRESKEGTPLINPAGQQKLTDKKDNRRIRKQGV